MINYQTISCGAVRFGFCTLLSMPCVALAIPSTNALVSDVVPILTTDMDPDFSPALGAYTYSIHWLVRTGAKAEISIERLKDKYHMTTTARTGRLVDVFYKARYRGEVVLDPESLIPENAEIRETVRSTHKHTVMEFRDGVIDSTRTRWKKGKPPFSVLSQQVDMDNGAVRDYFSAIIIARALQWHEGDKRSTVVFDGRGLNAVTLHCLGQKRIKAMGKKFDTWQILVKIVQIGRVDKDDELIADNIHLYLTTDNAREIVRLQADTTFGDIKIKLRSFKPASTTGAGGEGTR
jgi:hypothetical protein